MNLKKQGLKAFSYLKDMDRDDVLEAMGLQERSSAWGTALGTLGVFAIGCLVGAGLGLAFAPKAGTELRNELGDKMRRKANDLQSGLTGETSFGSTSSRSNLPVT